MKDNSFSLSVYQNKQYKNNVNSKIKNKIKGHDVQCDGLHRCQIRQISLYIQLKAVYTWDIRSAFHIVLQNKK
jgi:hypothetical protein